MMTAPSYGLKDSGFATLDNTVLEGNEFRVQLLPMAAP